MSETLQALEQTISTLSFSEKLWLLERIAQLLRTPHPIELEENWDNALADMAADPDIQAEIAHIDDEFRVAEMDGLNNS
ncbi:hypothetical protein [Leptolyngbya iicbica]|uniref:Addiction module component n=2 Tax=Cyanophyceae TaxID=3028117 RepID=A0A4V2E235_9CYAN|nr:hypothetical protein [Leptolyngbya sp. LK]RZM76666.1 hypothetical protein DYY88_18605 [Leptolyngbya sp. LK]